MLLTEVCISSVFRIQTGAVPEIPGEGRRVGQSHERCVSLSVCVSVCLSLCLSVCLSLSVSVSVCVLNRPAAASNVDLIRFFIKYV